MKALKRLLSNENHDKPKSETKITFTKDWGETLEGSLISGEDIHIVYDPARLSGHDQREGHKAGEIFAEVKYADSDEVHSKKLEGLDKNTAMMFTNVNIPTRAKTFIIWFKQHGPRNEDSYDSNNNQNYVFPLSRIIFTNTWEEYVSGDLFPGGRFEVSYDSSRLPWRDKGFLGLGRAWDITAHARFSDDGPVIKQMLKGPETDDPTMRTVYDIPEDADKVVMWFCFTGHTSGIHYDSNENANYHFPLRKE